MKLKLTVDGNQVTTELSAGISKISFSDSAHFDKPYIMAYALDKLDMLRKSKKIIPFIWKAMRLWNDLEITHIEYQGKEMTVDEWSKIRKNEFKKARADWRDKQKTIKA
jgi:hypothetical protein